MSRASADALRRSLDPDHPRAWEASHAERVRELMSQRLFIVSLVYLASHAAGLVVALAVVGDVPELDMWLRGVTVGLLVVFVALSRARSLSHWAFAISVLLTLVNAAYVQKFVLQEGLSRADVAGMALIIVTTGLMFPYTVRQMVTVAAGVLVIYWAAAAHAYVPDDRRLLVTQSFYVVCAASIASIASWLGDGLRRREHRASFELAIEREKAERLLRNVLPDEIIERLKRSPSAIADAFDEATIVFADICGFTPLSAVCSPEDLVELLNEVFSEFDALTERHGLEKIKTIGDAYMAAAGLPSPHPDPVRAAARMALEMREVVERVQTPTGDPLRIRIGINTGPVVAGVIGTKKFIYDLWGDAVNTASRMESHAQDGTIMLTEASARHLEADFELEPCGEIEIKGKGAMRAWRLVGEKA